ncbi:MAG: hypothetical protein JST48_13530 [Bacteroidetes bacterium]|nr:hypothetical protein [Bacteroidota bacterium]
MKVFQIIVLTLLIGCKQKAHTQATLKSNLIDLDSYQAEKVDLNDIYKGHPFLHKIGAQDEFSIGDKLESLKVAKYTVKNGESDLFLSKLEIRNGDKVVFTMDSVLNMGMYFFEKNKNMLAIPIILSQSEDLSIETELYVLDLDDNHIIKLDEILTNCSFAFICPNGSVVIYNSADKILSYNLNTNEKRILADFDNPDIRIIKLGIVNDLTEIFYSDDFLNDFIEHKQIKLVKFRLTEATCK